MAKKKKKIDIVEVTPPNTYKIVVENEDWIQIFIQGNGKYALSKYSGGTVGDIWFRCDNKDDFNEKFNDLRKQINNDTTLDNLEISVDTHLWLKSPNGSLWKVKVQNDGTLKTVKKT